MILPRGVDFIETESRMLVARRWREGERFDGYRFSVWADEKKVWRWLVEMVAQ